MHKFIVLLLLLSVIFLFVSPLRRSRPIPAQKDNYLLIID